MKPTGLCALATVLVPLLTACGVTPSPTVATGTTGLSATLETTPAAPIPLAVTTLELTLRDRAGQPVTGATVQLDLTMPGMAMPPNHPAVVEIADGVYQAQAVFTMAGDWQIQADVSYEGQSEFFTFPLRTR